MRFFSRFCTLRGAQQRTYVQIILCQTVQDDGIRAEQRERTALGLNECGVTAKVRQDAQQQAGGLVGDTKIDALGLVGQHTSGEECGQQAGECTQQAHGAVFDHGVRRGWVRSTVGIQRISQRAFGHTLQQRVV